MKYYFRYLAFLLLFMSAGSMAQTASQAFIAGDFADPSVIKAGDKYYAIGTSSEWAPHFPVYTSDNLETWKQVGYVFDKAPEWTSGSFWAPEYFFHNNTYYIYYTARRKSDNVSYIGVATSKYPDRGFKDHGTLVTFGKEAIDAFVYNDNGQLYITFKAYGLDKRPIEILGSKLSADGLELEGEPFSLLVDTNRKGMEGQSILKNSDYYYLFYSAGGCCGTGCSYNVRVARSKSFKGPYEDYPANPILQSNDLWKCPGHGTFVKQNDGKYMYLHHAYNKENTVFTGREAMLAELAWNNDQWPSLTDRESKNSGLGNFVSTFKENKIATYWQWDFRNSTPAVSQKNGKLSLSGTVKSTNNSGVVLTVRPVSRHFDLTATVANSNSALKGLAFYGDARAAVGVGARDDKVEFWLVRNNQRRVIAENTIKAGIPVELKLTMTPDLTCAVFYRQNNEAWRELGAGSKTNIAFLPQWDRSPRPGLHFQGSADQKAEFSSFGLTNY